MILQPVLGSVQKTVIKTTYLNENLVYLLFEKDTFYTSIIFV